MPTKVSQKIQKLLQESLLKGWQEFQKDEAYKLLADYSDELRKSGFFESKFRKIIPHPGHDNAAKKIGKYFLSTLIELEMNVDQFFPGDFDKSTESSTPEYELRNFYMTVYKKQKAICLLKISYPHGHSSFVFPAPPTVTIEKEFEN